jgi:lipoprotein-anchoring transpeptidase ErfK/SrfK
MVDYYSILLRAVTAPGAGDEQWRRALYARSRQMLASRLRAQHPQASSSEIEAEESALDNAIERLEAELAWTNRGLVPRPEAFDDRDGDFPSAAWAEPERGPIAPRSRVSGAGLIALAVVAAALGALGYVFWVERTQRSVPPVVKSEAATPEVVRATVTSKNGDLAPGVDGGSSDVDLPYVFRRQPIFYRTLQPAGTIIIDKLQHFLYLIQPNSVALRYGIGLGEHCNDLVGLRHIASKAEWPPWQPPPDLLKRNPAILPGGPGNPLGARLLELDDGASRIHGTNAPKTIGNFVAFGCIRLINDDIVDLYNRVDVSTPVIVN